MQIKKPRHLRDGDVEIRFERSPDPETPDPLCQLDGSYEEFARMSSRTIVTTAADAFSSHVDSGESYRIVLDDKHRAPLVNNWVSPPETINTTRNNVHELTRVLQNMLSEWRSP